MTSRSTLPKQPRLSYSVETLVNPSQATLRELALELLGARGDVAPMTEEYSRRFASCARRVSTSACKSLFVTCLNQSGPFSLFETRHINRALS